MLVRDRPPRTHVGRLMRTAPRSRARHAAAWLLAAALATGAGRAATAPAHEHGVLHLDLAIEAQGYSVQMETPLDNLVGFERAPRSEAERQAVAAALARLRDAARLFATEPAAGCRPAKVTLESAALGEGTGAAAADAHGHADLDASYAFDCTQTDRLAWLDVDLFEAFPRVQRIEVQIAAPGGQFKRTLRRPARRLAWAR